MSAYSETVQQLVAQILAGTSGLSSQHVERQSYDSPLMRKLDSLFWMQAEQVVTSAVNQNVDRPVFSREDRLLLDMGVVDDRLLGLTNSADRTQVVRELSASSHGNYYYTTQWLSERLHQFMALTPLTSPSSTAVSQAPIPDSSTITKLVEVRQQIYSAVRPLLVNQPGMTGQLLDLLCSGKLDSTILELSRQSALKPDSVNPVTLEKLRNLRHTFLLRAQESCTTAEQRTALDSLVRVDTKISRWFSLNSSSETAVSAESKLDVPSARERIAFLLTELRFMKSVLRLGIAHTGLRRPQSVFLPGQKHISKVLLASIVQSIYEADVNLPEAPNILIAPYTGIGFFEWDRDTVFVPLNAIRSEEESVAAAFANLHMLTDALRCGGALQKAYVAAVKPADFHASFTKAYQKWILGVCQGDSKALNKAEYGFFRQYIGPSPQNLFAPRALVPGSATDRLTTMRDCRQRIAKDKPNSLDYYRLAVIYWSDGRVMAAKEQMAMAAKFNSGEGRTVFVLGYICRELREWEGARVYFEHCIVVSPNTLWRVMAEEYLATLP